MNDQPAKPKLKKLPRNPESYRAARKKAARAAGRPMLSLAHAVVQEAIAQSAELNRSQKFPRAADYNYAREISPSKEPVR
jgi:hypothetical protein